jgi:hypothetical protein
MPVENECFNTFSQLPFMKDVSSCHKGKFYMFESFIQMWFF